MNVLLAQLSVSVLTSRTTPRTPNGMERSGIVCVCVCARDESPDFNVHLINKKNRNGYLHQTQRQRFAGCGRTGVDLQMEESTVKLALPFISANGGRHAMLAV